MDHSQIVSFIWGVADLIRDTFKRGKYPDVILPFMVLRRLNCVMAPTNLSLFAFTATPKAKTLELFGTRQSDGSFRPWHLYSMRQAIEEGCILDVLENYVTYETYWKLLKVIEADPRYEKDKAAFLLKSF